MKGQNFSITDSIRQVIQQNPDLSDSVVYELYCEMAFNASNPYEIIEYSKEAIAFAKAQQMEINLAKAVTTLGIGYLKKGDLLPATKAFIEGASLYEKADNAIGVATAYGNLARIYRAQNQPGEARAYYKKAIQIYREHQDSVRLASTLHNVGYLHFKSSEPDSALFYLEEALQIFKSQNESLLSAYGIGTIGLVHAQKGHFDLAEDKLRLAISQLQAQHDNFAIAEFTLEMSSIYQERGIVDKALAYAQEGFKLSKEVGAKEFIRDGAMQLAELYAQLEQYQQAYNYQKEYIAYRDSINNVENLNKIANINKEYEIAQKQNEIDKLQSESKTQQLFMLGLILIMLMAAVLIFLLYKYIQQKQASNRILSSQNELLAHQRNELEQLNATRNKFFSIISHDLRGPVNAFNGISRLIWHYINEKDYVQLNEVATYIDKSASQLSSLLDNLLSWAVLQQGTFPHNPEEVMLDQLVDETVSIFQTTALSKNINLHTSIAPGMNIWADRNGVLTILRNLTGNAFKFTKAGGTITITALAIDAFAVIRISDTGIGIYEEQLPQLFNQKKEKRTWGIGGEKGLGIGLKLVHDFVLMNGGHITVESQQGNGTTFIVKLPLSNRVQFKHEPSRPMAK